MTLRFSLCIASAMCLMGCSTVFKGGRVSQDGTLASDKEGIPFTLTRPEFRIERDGNKTPVRYKLSVAYVADPSQRYTLRLSPALLANVTFGLDLGEEGEISNVTGKVTEQLSPTIKSVFSFVTSALSTAAVFAAASFEDSAGPEALCVSENTVASEAYCLVQRMCPNDSDLRRRVGRFLTPDPSDPGPLEPKGDDKGNVFSALHFRDQQEYKCVSEVSVAITNYNNLFADKIAAKIDSATNPDPTNPKALYNLFAEALKESVKKADVPKARRLMSALAAAKDTTAASSSSAGGAASSSTSPSVTPPALPNEAKPTLGGLDRYRFLKRELGVDMVSTTDDELAHIETLLQAAGFQNAKMPAAPVVKLAQTRKVATGFRSIVLLRPPVWRARHLTYMSEIIDWLKLPARLGGGSAEQLADAEREFAQTAGKEDAHARLARLDREILNALPPPQPSDRLSAFEEYNRVRLEADRLRQEIAQAAEGIIAGAKPATADPADLPITIPLVDVACVTRSQQKDWIYGEGASAPDFIVVLSGPAVDARRDSKTVPISSGECS